MPSRRFNLRRIPFATLSISESENLVDFLSNYFGDVPERDLFNQETMNWHHKPVFTLYLKAQRIAQRFPIHILALITGGRGDRCQRMQIVPAINQETIKTIFSELYRQLSASLSLHGLYVIGRG